MIVSLLALAVVHKQALKLPSLFSDNMVLQRDMRVQIFGIADPSESVAVQIAGQHVTTTAGADGKWETRLQPMKAGGPYTALIQTSSATLTLKNVMVGEVWVCSGQSNMEMPESLANDYQQAQDEADPTIRLFRVNQNSAEEPASEAKGSWALSTKDTVGDFSAVALSFGRELHDRLNVPVGLIQASWGGTKAEAWTSRDALNANEVLGPLVDSYVAALRGYPEKNAAFRKELHEWIASRADSGNEGFLKGWENRILDDSDWAKVEVPNIGDSLDAPESANKFDGAVWFRRTFELPEGWEGKALTMELGTISVYDDTYVNGTKVGATKVESQDASKIIRIYRISPGILLSGTNVIAVRVYAPQGVCGFTGHPDQMRISLATISSNDPVPLAGEWRERVERKVDTTVQAPHMPFGPGNPNVPGGLFNGMIAPLTSFGIKGAIWYQGESNVGQADVYKVLFPAMIRDWRQRWNEGAFPFYFVQLANYKPRQELPGDSDWAELREAQTAALKLPNTGMATAIDLGSESTIHPKNKRDVGKRLALIALSKDYGTHSVWSGPEYQYMTQSGNTIRVFFKHSEDGLKTNDGKPPKGFAIAGDDRHFYWADAHIEGTAVVLSNPNVPNPIAVRYAWADNPDVNLYNSADLPANPFRTDSWRQPIKTP